MWSGPRSIMSLMLLVGLATGCQNKAKQAAGLPPPSPQDAAAVRQRYMQLNANNRVGVVTAVRPESHLAAVGDVPLQDFSIGDVLTFIDAHEQPFNTGEVVNASSTSLHVKYDAKRRAPREGELAVRLR